MKHHLSHFLVLSAVSAITALSATAQTETVVFELTSTETFSQCTQSSIQYERDDYDTWNFSAYSKYAYCYSYYVTSPYYADYLTTPDLALQTGVLYKVKTAPAAYYSSYVNGTFEVLLGSGDDLASYTTIGKHENVPYYSYNSSPEIEEYQFSVPEDGNYKISFLVSGAPMYMYNTSIVSLGESDVPNTVSDFTVVPDAAGGTGATVRFHLPTSTISTKTLTDDLTYVIKRNGSFLEEGSGRPGALVEYVDTNVTSGVVSYSVIVYNGQEAGDEKEVTTYIGVETPLAATNVTLASVGSLHTLTWDAPTLGTHGAILTPDALTYIVTRVLDGVETQLAPISATTFTETIEPVGLQSLSYKVVVKNGEMTSDAAASNVVTIGSLNLPFADSFAGGEFGAMWETEIVSQSTNWVAISTVTTSTNPKPEPFDEDGGMAYYNAYSTQKGGSARLITAPISAASSTNSVVSFYFHHNTAGDDVVKLQISCDGGEWTDIEGASVTNKASESGWAKYTFSIKDAITANCVAYRIAFTAVSAYGYNMFVDNVRIFNLAEKDLAITSLTAPESVIAGNDAVLMLKLSNNGTTDLAADDYTIDVETDFPDDIADVTPVAVGGLGETLIPITVPITALHAYNAENYSFKAKIELTDEDAANNVSEEVVVPVTFSTLTPAANLDVVKADDSLAFSWEPAGDVDYEPLSITESFEDFEEDATGPFNGFVCLDLDQQAGSLYYATGANSAFNIVAPSSNSKPTGLDGSKVIGVTCKANKTEDDWIISPLLSCKETSHINLSFLVGFKAFSYSYYSYSWEIRYATADSYDAENPLEAFSQVVTTEKTSSYGSSIKYDDAMHLRSYEIPGNAKYVAIRFTTNISYDTATWVDNISLTEVSDAPLLGYNLYELGVGRVNDELISSKATEYELSTDDDASASKREFFISAVYGEGESVNSNVVTFMAIVDGIANVAVDTNAKAVGNGVAVEAAVGAKLAVYDMSGRMVVSTVVKGSDHVALAPGVYIVNIDGKCTKVVVK